MRRHETPIKRVNPSGREVWIARYTGRDGKRRSAGTFPLKREAQAAIDAAYDREADMPEVVGAPQTVRQYVAVWPKLHPRSERTNETNVGRIQRQLDVKLEGRKLGDWLLAELRPRHGKLLLDALLADQGRAVAGARNVLMSLSAMLEDAVEDEAAIVNPFKGVKIKRNDPRIRKQSRKARVLSKAQMRALAAASGPHEPMLRVLSDCGLRLGELLGLYRADMALDACAECDTAGAHFHVRRTAWKGSVSDGTKRERMRDQYEGGRVVPIPAGLEAMLRAMPRRIDTRMLFPGPEGDCWLEHRWRKRVWYPAVRKSGVTASPHDFRHSWISELRAAGVDRADLAQMSGHDEDTATAVYTHALGRSYDAVREAVGE